MVDFSNVSSVGPLDIARRLEAGCKVTDELYLKALQTISPPLLPQDMMREVMKRRFKGVATLEGGLTPPSTSAASGSPSATHAHSDTPWQPTLPPRTTALGALLAHVTGEANAETFQPMNVNFGLFPDIQTKERGREKKKAMAHRALADLAEWLEKIQRDN